MIINNIIMLGLIFITAFAFPNYALCKDISIFGVTLGKTFQESGIKECEKKFYSEDKGPEKTCYVIEEVIDYSKKYKYDQTNGSTITVLPDEEIMAKHVWVNVPHLGPLRYLEIRLSDDNRVVDISTYFSRQSFDEVFSLFKENFGQPGKIKTITYKIMDAGESFDQIEYTWNIEGNMIYIGHNIVMGGKQLELGDIAFITHNRILQKERLEKSR